MYDVRSAESTSKVEGLDGYVLAGSSTMKEISRDPFDLVAQTIGQHHQYPDGFVLFMGTPFAPVEDSDTPRQSFTHKVGDVVTISNPQLGALTNKGAVFDRMQPVAVRTSHLMRNLASRSLI